MSQKKFILLTAGLVCNLAALLLLAWIGFRKTPANASPTAISIQLGRESVQKGIRLVEWEMVVLLSLLCEFVDWRVYPKAELVAVTVWHRMVLPGAGCFSPAENGRQQMGRSVDVAVQMEASFPG
jgi:hypothetical protein